MLGTWSSGTGGESYWQSATVALSSLATALNTEAVGLQLFPDVSPDAGSVCVSTDDVGIEPKVSNADDIVALLAATQPSTASARPAALAVQTAHAALSTWLPAFRRTIVFVSAGVPNCGSGDADVYDAAVCDMLLDAFDAGVRAYVVGIEIDGGIDPVTTVDAHEVFNEMALSSGNPRPNPERPDELFIGARSHAELGAALDALRPPLMSCTYALSEAVVHPHLTQVWIGDEVAFPVTDCDVESGWTYTNPAGPFDAIELCGSLCEQAKDVPALELVYYCPVAE